MHVRDEGKRGYRRGKGPVTLGEEVVFGLVSLYGMRLLFPLCRYGSGRGAECLRTVGGLRVEAQEGCGKARTTFGSILVLKKTSSKKKSEYVLMLGVDARRAGRVDVPAEGHLSIEHKRGVEATAPIGRSRSMRSVVWLRSHYLLRYISIREA